MTPFSLYQGRWNAAFRDMESKIIPMCEDRGMAIVSWASLGGGQLVAAEQRKRLEEGPDSGKGYYNASEDDIIVCGVLERLAKAKNAGYYKSDSRALYCATSLTQNRRSHICSTSLLASFPSLACKLLGMSNFCPLQRALSCQPKRSMRYTAQLYSTRFFPTTSCSRGDKILV